MELQKVTALVFMVCVVMGAAAAVALIVMDGTGHEGVDTSDCIVNTFKEGGNGITVGDYYEYTVTDPRGNTDVERHQISRIVGDSIYIKSTVDGQSDTRSIPMKSFYSLVKGAFEYSTYPDVGTEKVDTPWGKVYCDVKSGSAEGTVNTFYVGHSNGVCYVFESRPAAGGEPSVKVFSDSTLFNESKVPGHSNVAKKVKDTVEAGDFIELTVKVKEGFNDREIKDRYTVESVGADGKLVVKNVRDGAVNSIVMSKQDFTDMLNPVMGGSQFAEKRVLDTVWGKIQVDVYYTKVPHGSGFIGYNLFVDENGILFKSTELADNPSGGSSTQTWFSDYVLSDTSMLQGYIRA